MALLAKQGWKIIIQPNCLFARVMKSKYFPKGNFMHTELKAYPSFTWRIIWGARRILEEGIGWRVGNGEGINIWNDAWIPGSGNGRVQCQFIDTIFTTVADLIDKDTSTWKHDIIRSLFGEEQLKRILAIPLVHGRPQDVLIWRGDNSVNYTVKNGYKWIITDGNTRLQTDKRTIFFTKLWGLKIPIYPVCQEEEETTEHLFQDCKFTQKVLQGMEVLDSTCNRETTWKDWLIKEFNSQNTKKCEIKAISYWAIWYNSNKVYHEGAKGQVNDLLAFIKAYYAEITELGELSKQTSGNQERRWNPPERNTIKLNFDASFNQNMEKSVSGVIARNNEGLVMVACTYPWDYTPDPITAEARACLQAIIMAEEMGFQEICVEGDSLTIIKKVNSLEDDRSNISNLIKKIRGRLPKFRATSFRHIPREANRAAHEMAREGNKYDEPRYWVEEAPAPVERLVIQEIRWGGGKDLGVRTRREEIGPKNSFFCSRNGDNKKKHQEKSVS
ncbi:reverse transcriptase [Gossypium australe]|uniref:Reverse transcriptase n=1 Tax=Gossypium australe TaxID=47621 RepID=A0A5B6VU56_9ROSI|nr:reverse transcriptase [Gossypium australe]